ncbi:MAG: YidC/Oxa1 family membrane protein insertase [Candidatus Faecousia sp.]|nr:YidC/Oxa1 family membrane protein insertase [Candidatus Faecousia sp.]
MFLAFQLSDIITVPFGWLLAQLYHLTNNYGVAMILFAILVQLILMPINAKSKKSMMKMSRLTPRIQDIQARYANDPQKQNEMMQKLYQDEGVSMGGGCVWSLIPMLILFPLFAVIRQPITYILLESEEITSQIISVIKTAAPDIFSSNSYYDQVIAAQAIPQFANELRAAIPGISEFALAGINFNFLGINLGMIPQFNVFSASWAWDWAHIGAFLIPMVSAGSQVLQMWISQKTNDSVITDEKGVQDKETAKNSQQNQSMKVMMWTMPLMSLWIGFTVAAGLSLYWFVGGVVRMISDPIMTNHYRKIYDAEDAVRLQKAMEEDRIEAEKERIRAERRAANPDGITTNTSKKKLQKQQRDQEQAEKAAAAKEYAARKGIVEDAQETDSCLSGIPSRPFCKGRNYDPNRYASKSTEE